jgi:hypothetical protein
MNFRENFNKPDEHHYKYWTVGAFAAYGSIVAVLVLFLAFNPNAEKLASDIAQSEFPTIQPIPDGKQTEIAHSGHALFGVSP